MLNKTLPLVVMSALLLPAGASCNEEEIPANEVAATQQIVRMIEDSVRAEAKKGLARRDAHAKTHGCVQAQFRVLDNLPEKVRVGIFGEARSYPAWIRYSNGSGKVQDDSVGDARGMAIKLMGVERSDSSTQDFLMISHPTFFVRNATDYVEFQKAFSEDSPFKFFFPGFNPFNFRLHEFRIANAIRETKMSNPLYARYWSTTPYRFGNTEMKFSGQSCSTSSPFTETAAPNFLHENMQKHLAQSEACVDFLIQLRKLPTEMPIEDPTIEWSEKDAPFIHVARITIPVQTFNSPEQLAFCENLSFTPWHAIPEHRPLGGINRMRKTVYDTIARVRHEINGDKHLEPTGF
ncbi:catalase family protein [Methylomonas sp. AM2-LC]|uniref:catalase family protein n=1 Tax=Methylomonas sp. AM2-LC TaxID=3153301 RepID=UPI003266A3E3